MNPFKGEKIIFQIFSVICQISSAKIPFVEKEEHYYSSDAINQVWKEIISFQFSLKLSWWLSGKEFACQCRRHGFDPWSSKIRPAVERLSSCAITIEPVLFILQWYLVGHSGDYCPVFCIRKLSLCAYSGCCQCPTLMFSALLPSLYTAAFLLPELVILWLMLFSGNWSRLGSSGWTRNDRD